MNEKKDLEWLRGPNIALVGSLISGGMITPSTKVILPEDPYEMGPFQQKKRSVPKTAAQSRLLSPLVSQAQTRGPTTALNSPKSKKTLTKRPETAQKPRERRREMAPVPAPPKPDDGGLNLPPISDLISTKPRIVTAKDGQELLASFRKQISEIQDRPNETPHEKFRNIMEGVDISFLFWNKVITDIRSYSEDYSKLLNEIKSFYKYKLAEFPDIGDEFVAIIDAKERENNQLFEENMGLKKQIQEYEETIQHINNQSLEYQAKIEDMRVKEAELRHRIADLEYENDQTKQEFTQLNCKIIREQNTVKELEEQVANLQNTIVDNQFLIKSQEQEIQKFQEKGASFRPMYLEASKELADLKLVLQKKDQEIEKLSYRPPMEEVEVMTDESYIEQMKSQNKSKHKRRGKDSKQKEMSALNQSATNLATSSPGKLNIRSSPARSINNFSNEMITETPNSNLNKSSSRLKNLPESPNTSKVDLMKEKSNSKYQLETPKKENIDKNDSLEKITGASKSLTRAESVADTSKIKPSSSKISISLKQDEKVMSYSSHRLISMNEIIPKQEQQNQQQQQQDVKQEQVPETPSILVQNNEEEQQQKQEEPPKEETEKPQEKKNLTTEVINDGQIITKDRHGYVISIGGLAPTMVDCMYRLLPLNVEQPLTEPATDVISLTLRDVNIKPKSYTWLLSYIIDFFCSFNGTDMAVIMSTDAITLLKNCLQAKSRIPTTTNRLYVDILNTAQLFKGTSGCVNFFIQFLIQEYSTIDLCFFNVLFSLCYDFLYPKTQSLLEYDEVTTESYQFLIHVDLCQCLLDLLFPFSKGKVPIDVFKKGTRSTPSKKLVSFWEFAKYMLQIFRQTHMQFHKQVKALLNLSGHEADSQITEEIFSNFFILSRPFIKDDEIKKLWERYSLEQVIKKNTDLNIHSLIQFCADFPEVTNTVLELPYASNFDSIYGDFPIHMQKLMLFFRKRYTKFMRKVVFNLPSHIRAAIEQSYVRIRNSIIRCDLSTCVTCYRHFLQVSDLKITEDNPYLTFASNVEPELIDAIIKMLAAREMLVSEEVLVQK